MSVRRLRKWGGWIAVFLLALISLIVWIKQPLLTSPLAPPVGEAVDAARLREHVDFLVGQTGGRNYARPAVLNRAAGYIEAEFLRAGGKVRSQWFEVDGERYRNVIATFGPAGKPVVVVGAHYDVEQDTRGADDNASGVAGLLELATALGRQPPGKSVELVAYTLEEPPYFNTEHMGSRQHAAALVKDGAAPALILVLEMIGYFDDRPGSQTYPMPGMSTLYPDRGDFIAVVGNFLSPGVVRRVKAGLAGNPQLPVESINAPAWVPGVDFSDHASYWRHGLPAVMVTDTSFFRNQHYHKASDLPETLDYRRMALVVQGVIGLLRSMT